MNIFILNTGRCGSMTFIKACEHITNYTTGHETRAGMIAEQRFAYPQNHIEADNRLSWYLGRLDQLYANNAFYVHLYRDPEQTADSFVRRMDYGIMKAYREGILLEAESGLSDHDLARDYIDTVTSNIRHFLKDKTHTMDFRLENAKQDFELFWQAINADGNLQAALAEWDMTYNAS